jgi:hypothetical protein
MNKKGEFVASNNKEFQEDLRKLIEHYQYPREKQKLQDFLEETYRKYETEKIDQTISRVMHEHESEMQGSKPFYKPGHIGPLIYEHMNMIAVENAFVSGLQHTKSSMVKTIQHRVDEINTLLRGVGGFNRQLKANFSRSAVVYLEQDDPSYPQREKVVFSINLSDFELRYPMDEEAANVVTEDGRSGRRYGWDYGVNVLSEIVSNTGLKPKYVKNDKNTCKFVMSQSLLTHNDPVPDEFFSFSLEYLTEENIKQRINAYDTRIASIEEKIERRKKSLDSIWQKKHKKDQLRKEINWYEKELSFYIGTQPDPNEMDPGLLFLIEINTLKDYGITKDKMQVIMTKYVLALSNIARDKSMDQQLLTDYTKAENNQQPIVEKKGRANIRRQVATKQQERLPA